MSHSQRPVVAPESVSYAFVPYGFTAPDDRDAFDRLYLDVGNQLRPGAIDHHQLSEGGPTTALVRNRAEFIDAAVSPAHTPGAAFTVILHNYPDLDAVASTLLALEYLENRAFPDRADALTSYVASSDKGETRLDPKRPFVLRMAFNRLVDRALDLPSQKERDEAIVRNGLALLRFALGESARTGTPIDELDALSAPVFTDADRAAVLVDHDRYRTKLKAPATHARRCRMRLPGQKGGEVSVEALLVRDVQNAGDPNRVAHFKDWARLDTFSRDGQGYAALSVFMPEEPGHPRRCILSVMPESGAWLKGLGQLLDSTETKRRLEVYGVDTRREDPVTGEKLPVRRSTPPPGTPEYDSADPWYDGRAGTHNFTIIDAPHDGTLLTADEIEKVFLDFGHATEIEPLID
jgi:hypothetical protein